MALYKTRRAFLALIKAAVPAKWQPECRRLIDSVLFRDDLEAIVDSGTLVGADDVFTTTTSFDDKLSSADDTVQKALDTLDDHVHAASEVTTVTTSFDGILSAADTEVQAALDTIDDWRPDHLTDIDNVGTNTHADIDTFIANQEAIIDAQEEPTGFEGAKDENTDSTISFDNGTRTFTIDDTGSGYSYWQKGVRYTNTDAKTIVIADTEGEHLIYFDGNELYETTSFSDELLKDYAYVAFVRWDATNSQQVLLADERHGLMPWQIHSLWHRNIGTVLLSGGGISGILADENGSLDTHAEYTVAATEIRDEDIPFTHTSSDSTAIDVYYKLGAGGDWRIAGRGPLAMDTGVPQWNEFTGGAWQLSNVSNTKLFLMHVLATNDRTRQYAIVVGENEYATIADAREGANTEISDLVLAGLPSEEFSFLGTIIYQYNGSYSNTYSSRIRTTDTGDDYVDWRAAEIGPGTGPTSHADLVNRDLADSHPATAISTDVTNFNAALSASDTDVQTALETLDDIVVLNTGDTMTGNLTLDTSGATLRLNSSGGLVTSDWSILTGFASNTFHIQDNANTLRPFAVEAGAANDTLVVDSNSRVGIKTASPAYDLDVQGTAAIGTNAQFLVESGAAANTLVVDSNSRVGIGTASPDEVLTVSVASGNAKLHFDGGSSTSLRVDCGNASSESSVDFEEAGTIKWRAGRPGSSTDFRIGSTLGAAAFRINSGAASQTLELTSAGVRVGGEIEFGSGGATITSGSAAPSAAEPDGSIYLRTGGGAGTTFYIRIGGSWTAVH